MPGSAELLWIHADVGGATETSGDGLPYEDPAALLVRHELSDGRLFMSLSVSLVALAEPGVRYDFLPPPDDPRTWHPVDIPREARG